MMKYIGALLLCVSFTLIFLGFIVMAYTGSLESAVVVGGGGICGIALFLMSDEFVS